MFKSEVEALKILSLLNVLLNFCQENKDIFIKTILLLICNNYLNMSKIVIIFTTNK